MYVNVDWGFSSRSKSTPCKQGSKISWMNYTNDRVELELVGGYGIQRRKITKLLKCSFINSLIFRISPMHIFPFRNSIQSWIGILYWVSHRQLIRLLDNWIQLLKYQAPGLNYKSTKEESARWVEPWHCMLNKLYSKTINILFITYSHFLNGLFVLNCRCKLNWVSVDRRSRVTFC